MKTQALNLPERGEEVQDILRKKKSLRKIYLEIYQAFEKCLSMCPQNGVAVEIGSGGGFSKEVITELWTTDIVPYLGVDQVLDATQLPFENHSVKAFFLWNVLHHIPSPQLFFEGALRCLKPGGRILLIEPYPGFLGKIILKYFHHEPYDDKTSDWSFLSSGPLTGANGALPWVIFERDRKKFESRYPQLKIHEIKKIIPLRYWLAGGLRSWSLLPLSLYPLAVWFDDLLISFSPNWGSFIQVEIVKN